MIQTASNFGNTINRHAPPVPGMSETSEDLNPHHEPEPPREKYASNYLPCSMQLIHYIVEVIPYELIDMTTIEPPFDPKGDSTSTTTTQNPFTTKSTTKWTTTTKPTTTTTKWTTTRWTPPTTTTTTTTTTRKPFSTTQYTTTTKPTTTTTRKTTSWTTTSTTPKPDLTTSSHKPGYYSPDKPPVAPVVADPVYVTYLDIPIDRPNKGPPPHKPATTIKPSSSDSIIGNQFFEWFFQSKAKQLRNFDYDTEYLDPLPKGLLQDINYEGENVPTLLDEDNVHEFLRVYDDFYPIQGRFTGKKKVPPTQVYIRLIMLYDMLKREAKKLSLNKFEGYSDEILQELSELSKRSLERQLHTCLSKMIENKNTDKADIISRSKQVIDEIENPNSIMSKTLRFIPPFIFLP